MTDMLRDLSIYLHIPFCVKKCRYCDFLSYPATGQEQDDYIGLLLSEIEEQSFFYETHRVISVFIGGGTPSILNGNAIRALLEKLKQNFIFAESPEITVEVNPGTVTADKLSAYRQAGANRLSIGLQSADDGELRTLGRIHDYAAFCDTYGMARRAGFRNINVDLMAAIPGQTLESYRKTLHRVLALEPEHIAAYSMILEENTWFYEHQEQFTFPTEEEDRMLYELTGEMLTSFGYHRYEISNYAKAGHECVHNRVYWQRGDYVGFGLGAASMVEEVRWSNKRTWPEYRLALRNLNALPATRSRLGEDIRCLTEKEQMEEFMFLGLRLTEGIKKQDFYQKFGISIENIYGETIEKLKRDGLLVSDGAVRLTPYGMDISNYVMARFLL